MAGRVGQRAVELLEGPYCILRVLRSHGRCLSRRETSRLAMTGEGK